MYIIALSINKIAAGILSGYAIATIALIVMFLLGSALAWHFSNK